MSIKLWEIEDNSDEYNALTLEQKDLANFLWKKDWEGGTASLWYHSRDLYFPEKLKPLARKFGEALQELEAATEKLSNELDIEW